MTCIKCSQLSVTAALIVLLVNIPTWWFSIPGTIPCFTHIPLIRHVLIVASVISRELFVSGLREWMATKGTRAIVKVGSLGKLKTALQMISITLLLHSSSSLPADLLSNPLSYLPIPSLSANAPPLSISSLLAFISSQYHLLFVGIGLFYLSSLLSLISAGQYLAAAWPTLTSQHYR